MPNFTPRPDRSLVRALTTGDEQLAGIFNQCWQAISDNLQVVTNNLIQLEQQANAIAATATSIENSFTTQQSALNAAQSSASPVIATSLQRNSDINTQNTANSTATGKISAANTALSAAEINLNSISGNAQPYNPLLQSISGMTRPNNSMLGTDGIGNTNWVTSTGQSFIVEFGYFAMRPSSGANGGAITSGSSQTVPINYSGFSNCRNQYGLVETSLDTNTVVLPCTGGNCRYYIFSLAAFSGVASANTQLKADGAVISVGSVVQSISGRSTLAENFNQDSSAFAPLNVTSQSRVTLEAVTQSANTAIPSAALGIGLASGLADHSSVLFFRRRFT